MLELLAHEDLGTDPIASFKSYKVTARRQASLEADPREEVNLSSKEQK